MIALIRANCSFIQQGIELLETHNETTYVRADATTFGSSIGAHFRHVLDHYASFLVGVESGLIDYDDRERDTPVENSLSAAIEASERIIESLLTLESLEDRSIRTRVSASVSEDTIESPSSLTRELQFLVSHTVHHYALIATASRMQGILPAEGFGVAPSTLKYLQASGC